MSFLKIAQGRCLAVGSAILLMSMVSPAGAQTLINTQKYAGNDENDGTVVLDADYAGPGGIDYFNTYIGPQSSTLSGYGGSPDPLTFDSYCVDLLNLAGHSPYPVEIHSTDDFSLGRPGVDHGGALAWLYNHYAPTAVNDNRQAGALQLAIWEAEYDWDGTAFVGGHNSSIDLKNGYFSFGGVVAGSTVDTDLLNRANGMLSNWAGQQDKTVWFKDSQATAQDERQALIGPRVTSQGVPEPGPLGLILIGAGGTLGLLRNRRRR